MELAPPQILAPVASLLLFLDIQAEIFLSPRFPVDTSFRIALGNHQATPGRYLAGSRAHLARSVLY